MINKTINFSIHVAFYNVLFSNADATCNFYPCESVIFVQFPCSMTKTGKMIESDHGSRWSRGCPMDDEFSGFYVIDGIKSIYRLLWNV